jgi:putative Mg2+ transporter-C (MgtC) family protein
MKDSIIQIFGIELVVLAAYKQIALAALIGFVVGFERALRGKSVSMRTFASICAGSCLFTVLSVEAIGGIKAEPHDVTRIAAQIVTGIGFIGGGVIFKASDRIEGITTGSLVWLASAIGMACGFNQIGLVLVSCLIVLFVHACSSLVFSMFHLEERRGRKSSATPRFRRGW